VQFTSDSSASSFSKNCATIDFRLEGVMAKHCWALSTNLLLSKVLPLHLKQTFLPIICIVTEGEVDRIETRILFKIFSTLPQIPLPHHFQKIEQP
jgi:hypothetical protein